MSRLSRLLAATLVGVGGQIHLHLWLGGYRGIRYVGPLFLANVVVSGLVALALLVRPNAWVLCAGALLATGSLIGLVLSRTVGLLGFTDPGLTHDALRSVAAELGALVALALVVIATRMDDPTPSLRPVPVLAGPSRA